MRRNVELVRRNVELVSQLVHEVFFPEVFEGLDGLVVCEAVVLPAGERRLGQGDSEGGAHRDLSRLRTNSFGSLFYHYYLIRL